MENIKIDTSLSNSNRHPVWRIISLIFFIVSGILIFNAIGLALLMPMYGFDTSKVIEVLSNPEKLQNAALSLLILQGCISIGSFVLMPLVYLKYVERIPFAQITASHLPKNLGLYLAVILLVPVFMPFNGLIIEWNEGLKLPAFLRVFEEWALEKEESLKELTKAITNLHSTGEYLLGVLVVAIIPAFGEELVFRGIVQNRLKEWLKNPHVAIWLAGFLFSVIHVQFYGLFPRMMLGMLFGYLYYWSGLIWLPMMAHFTNNFLTLTLLYLKNIKWTDFDVESTDSIPLPLVSVSLLVTSLFLYWIKGFFETMYKQNEPLDLHRENTPSV